MAPRISPGKTWEGTIGALLGGFATVVVLNWPLDLPMSTGEAVLLGLALPATAVVADLGESMLKRGAGVKDTSDLVPGHGGFLDRLDSLLFTVPLVYYFAVWVVLD
jgi:phosphatidate cytidylyltransferase